MGSMFRYAIVILMLALSFVAPGISSAQGPSVVSMAVDKNAVSPGETITVSFSVSGGLPKDAWIGIVPSNIPHGSESVNDQHDLTYQHLQGRTRGRLTFSAPTTPGLYDFRMHNTDNNGVEVAFVSFSVGTGPSAADNEPDGPSVSINSQGATVSIDKRSYRQGEKITVHFTAPANYASDAWIGIIPAHITHGSEAVNDQHDVAYQYIQKRTEGEMTFTAPHPGQWDIRLHDTDNNGQEVTYVTFVVH